MKNAGGENCQLNGNLDVGDIQLQEKIHNPANEKLKELEREVDENGEKLRQSGFSFVLTMFCHV